VVAQELAKAHRASVGDVPPADFVRFDDGEYDDEEEESENSGDVTQGHTQILGPRLLEAIQETLRSPGQSRRASAATEHDSVCWEEGEEEGQEGFLESDSRFLVEDEDEYEEEDCEDTIVRLSKFIELPAWSEAFRQSLTPLRDTIQRRFSEAAEDQENSECMEDTLAGEETRMMLALSQDPSFRSLMVKNQQELLAERDEYAETVSGKVEENNEWNEDFTKLTVAQLRARCKSLCLSTSGKKAALVERLQVHIAADRALAQSEEDFYEEDEEPIANVAEQIEALQLLLQQIAAGTAPGDITATDVAATLRSLLARI